MVDVATVRVYVCLLEHNAARHADSEHSNVETVPTAHKQTSALTRINRVDPALALPAAHITLDTTLLGCSYAIYTKRTTTFDINPPKHGTEDGNSKRRSSGSSRQPHNEQQQQTAAERGNSNTSSRLQGAAQWSPRQPADSCPSFATRVLQKSDPPFSGVPHLVDIRMFLEHVCVLE